MSQNYRKAQRILRTRRFIRRVSRRWRIYGCSCGEHNMRGNK
ncbi:hypothetical protein SEA_PATELGO_206 [Streptomyces phage Patelgo]|nr:hypothetical protein SEA_PATELGO_206 [Streptomyces phage Patelgo]